VRILRVNAVGTLAIHRLGLVKAAESRLKLPFFVFGEV
jgi:hypothetical protein